MIHCYIDFFKAQCENPTKGDWVSGVKTIIEASNIKMSFGEISLMSKGRFMNMVENKINLMAFNYLKQNIKIKGSEINYGEYLTCQQYLLPNNILSIDDQREIFAYRTRMNNLKYNFSNNSESQYCLCKHQILTNQHLFNCEYLNNEKSKINLEYDRIFNGTLMEQKAILNIIRKNMRILSDAQVVTSSSR